MPDHYISLNVVKKALSRSVVEDKRRYRAVNSGENDEKSRKIL